MFIFRVKNPQCRQWAGLRTPHPQNYVFPVRIPSAECAAHRDGKFFHLFLNLGLKTKRNLIKDFSRFKKMYTYIIRLCVCWIKVGLRAAVPARVGVAAHRSVPSSKKQGQKESEKSAAQSGGPLNGRHCPTSRCCRRPRRLLLRPHRTSRHSRLRNHRRRSYCHHLKQKLRSF